MVKWLKHELGSMLLCSTIIVIYLIILRWFLLHLVSLSTGESFPALQPAEKSEREEEIAALNFAYWVLGQIPISNPDMQKVSNPIRQQVVGKREDVWSDFFSDYLT